MLPLRSLEHGSLDYHVGDQTMQIYGKFKIFLLHGALLGLVSYSDSCGMVHMKSTPGVTPIKSTIDQ